MGVRERATYHQGACGCKNIHHDGSTSSSGICDSGEHSVYSRGTAEVQKIEMKDDVTKVEISKTDVAGKELPGAKLTILDE